MIQLKKIDTSIVIPIYNEAQVISSVIEGVKDMGYKNIIIVDDGSSDNSHEVIDGLGVLYIQHAINRGKGAAVQTGLEAAKMIGAYGVVVMDGDGQHDPQDIQSLIEGLNDGADVALGYRSFRSGEVPYLKRVYNYIGNILTFFLCGLWIEDSQSGFRAFSNDALKALDLRSDRYEHESEVIWEIYKKKLNYREIPISVRYTEYSQSKLHKQNLKNGAKTFLKMLMFK